MQAGKLQLIHVLLVAIVTLKNSLSNPCNLWLLFSNNPNAVEPTSHVARLSLKANRDLTFTARDVRRNRVDHIEELARLIVLERLSCDLDSIDKDVERPRAGFTAPIRTNK